MQSIGNAIGGFFIELIDDFQDGTVSEPVVFLIFFVIPYVILFSIDKRRRENKEAREAGFKDRKEQKQIMEEARQLEIQMLPPLPEQYRKPLDTYFRAFQERKAELIHSVSSRLLFLSTKRSIQQLEKFGIKKEFYIVEDKELNQYMFRMRADERSTSIHTAQTFFYGSVEIDYRDIKTDRVVKRIKIPKTQCNLGYIRSLEPKGTGAIVHCQNCGAQIQLEAQDGHCPFCDSVYIYGDFSQLLNAFGLESYARENPIVLALVFLPTLLPVLIAFFLTGNLITTSMVFGVSFILAFIAYLAVLRFLVGHYKSRTRTNDEGLNKMQVVSEGTHLFRTCCETAPEELDAFLRDYVHPHGHSIFRKLNDVEYNRMADYLPKMSRVDRIDERPEGQFLDLVLRAEELRQAPFGRFHLKSTSRKLRLWREAGVTTEKIEGVELSQCPNCGGSVSLLEQRQCPHCDSPLPPAPQVWRLYDME